MAEVQIKAHTRRGKNGKTVQVRSYTRRVGKKGIHSPKREKVEKPGEEFEAKMEEKNQAVPTVSPEEIKRRIEWEEEFKRADEERKRLGMSRERYSRYKLEQSNRKSAPKNPEEKPVEQKKFDDILEKVEDKIARFVDKYGGGRKYKKML